MENEEKVTAPEIKEKVTFMSNKTLALIGILALIAIVLLGLALYTRPQANKTSTNTAQKVLQTSLNIAPAVSVASSSAYTADIMLSTQRTKITVVQIELSYDPKVLSSVDIVPGTFFPNPTILLKKIDKLNGKISYILGIGLGQKPVTAQGQVAVLKFTPLPENGTSAINFASTSQVNIAGVAKSILTSTKGIQLTFTPNTPTPTP